MSCCYLANAYSLFVASLIYQNWIATIQTISKRRSNFDITAWVSQSIFATPSVQSWTWLITANSFSRLSMLQYRSFIIFFKWRYQHLRCLSFIFKCCNKIWSNKLVYQTISKATIERVVIIRASGFWLCYISVIQKMACTWTFLLKVVALFDTKNWQCTRTIPQFFNILH